MTPAELTAIWQALMGVIVTSGGFAIVIRFVVRLN